MRTLIVMCVVVVLNIGAGMQAQQVVTVDPGGQAPARSLESSVVKGMPYSAEITTETVQTLADGNRIARRTTGRVYRDSEGRVRREEDRPSGSPSITISDPVAGTTLALDAATRTARSSPSLFVIRQLVGNITVQQYQLAIESLGTPTAGTWSSPPVPATSTAGGGARGGRGRSGGDGAVEEKLADRFIEGVVASGIRRTTTIEKGAIGNEQPITIVSEEWRSPDLQILVMTDLTDPRTGRSTYRLLSINRSEPDPLLFKVPPDYTVQPGRGAAPAGGAGGRGRVGRGGQQ